MYAFFIDTNKFNFYCLAEEEKAELSSGSHIISNSSQIPATQLLLLGGCQRQKTQLETQIPDWALLCWQGDKPVFDLYINRANLNWKVIKRKHILHNTHCTVPFPTFPLPTFFFFFQTRLCLLFLTVSVTIPGHAEVNGQPPLELMELKFFRLDSKGVCPRETANPLLCFPIQ